MSSSLPRMTAGAERLMVENMLDRNRQALVDTLRGLSDAQARTRLVSSLTTPLGLVKHAAFAERLWFQRLLAGLPDSGCDGDVRGGDHSWQVEPAESVGGVLAEFDRACARSRAIAAGCDLADVREHSQLGPVSLRWIYLHMIEELARHAGHGDILREQILT